MAKVLELQLQHQSFQHSGLISFRIDWFDLLWVQRSLKSLFQDCNSKASIPWHSAFFMIQLSHPYMTTGKTIALTLHTFVGKVMSLVFNTLSRYVTAFLPRRKCLLISWLPSPSTGIWEPKKRKTAAAFTFPPFTCREVIGSDAIILLFECWVSSQLFNSPLTPSSRGSSVSLHFLPLEWYHLHIWASRWCEW